MRREHRKNIEGHIEGSMLKIKMRRPFGLLLYGQLQVNYFE